MCHPHTYRSHFTARGERDMVSLTGEPISRGRCLTVHYCVHRLYPRRLCNHTCRLRQSGDFASRRIHGKHNAADALVRPGFLNGVRKTVITGPQPCRAILCEHALNRDDGSLSASRTLLVRLVGSKPRGRSGAVNKRVDNNLHRVFSKSPEHSDVQHESTLHFKFPGGKGYNPLPAPLPRGGPGGYPAARPHSPSGQTQYVREEVRVLASR